MFGSGLSHSAVAIASAALLLSGLIQLAISWMQMQHRKAECACSHSLPSSPTFETDYSTWQHLPIELLYQLCSTRFYSVARRRLPPISSAGPGSPRSPHPGRLPTLLPEWDVHRLRMGVALPGQGPRLHPTRSTEAILRTLDVPPATLPRFAAARDTRRDAWSRTYKSDLQAGRRAFLPLLELPSAGCALCGGPDAGGGTCGGNTGCGRRIERGTCVSGLEQGPEVCSSELGGVGRVENSKKLTLEKRSTVYCTLR